MKRVVQFTRWLFWSIIYLFRNRWRQGTSGQVMQRTTRCWKPWRKFRPSLYRNDDGNMWQIWFTDERAYTERRTIDIECHIGMDSGDIVGLNVWDEVLTNGQ